MRLSHGEKKYWITCRVGIIDAAVSKDGLMFMFDQKDIQDALGKYPRGNKVWYFNESRDREIAELGYDSRVTVNPQFVYQNYGYDSVTGAVTP